MVEYLLLPLSIGPAVVLIVELFKAQDADKYSP